MLSTAAPAPVAVAENATVPSKPQTDENANPYISLIQKRLRNFKKRMARIEKYELEAKKNNCTLNEDQLTSISKKDEVSLLIREFEELVKAAEEKDLEARRKEKKANRAQHIEQQKRIAAAVEDAQEQFDEQLTQLARFFYANNVVVPLVPFDIISKSDREAMLHFQRTLTGFQMDPAIDSISMAAHAQKLMKKLLARSADEPAVADLNFERLSQLVEASFEYIQTPVAPEPQFMQPEAIVESVEEMPVEVVVIEPVVEIAAPTQLMFMTSSMLDEEELLDGPFEEQSTINQEVEQVEEEEQTMPLSEAAEVVSEVEQSQAKEQVMAAAVEISENTKPDKPFRAQRKPRGGSQYHQKGDRPFRGRGRDGYRGGFNQRGRGGFRGRGGRGGNRSEGGHRPPTVPGTSS